MVQISNFLDHPYTLKKGTHMENFSILTPEQTKHIRPVNPTSVRHLLINNHDTIHYINSLLKTSKTDEVNDTYWFPTPQNPGNEREQTPIQTRIFNELREINQLEKPTRRCRLPRSISIQFQLDRFYFTTGRQTSR